MTGNDEWRMTNDQGRAAGEGRKGADGRTLFITARKGLYSIPVAVKGAGR